MKALQLYSCTFLMKKSDQTEYNSEKKPDFFLNLAKKYAFVILLKILKRRIIKRAIFEHGYQILVSSVFVRVSKF